MTGLMGRLVVSSSGVLCDVAGRETPAEDSLERVSFVPGVCSSSAPLVKSLNGTNDVSLWPVESWRVKCVCLDR